MHVQQLRCPGCFAPVDARQGGVLQCRYCGSTMAFEAPSASPESLFLDDVGRNKIAVIKVVHEHTGLGLKEAKELVERAPCLIAQWDDSQRMAAFQRDLTEAGARTH